MTSRCVKVILASLFVSMLTPTSSRAEDAASSNGVANEKAAESQIFTKQYQQQREGASVTTKSEVATNTTAEDARMKKIDEVIDRVDRVR
jgi:hypothetical protein